MHFAELALTMELEQISPHLNEMMNRDAIQSDGTLERTRTGQLRILEFVYVVNATLLICHEIDSAYWREWELFHIPGGAAAFVALHIPLVAIVLWGLVQTARGSPAWRWYSLLLSFAGIGGGLVHLAFLFAEFDDHCGRCRPWGLLRHTVRYRCRRGR